jgi:hypothetical protein
MMVIALIGGAYSARALLADMLSEAHGIPVMQGGTPTGNVVTVVDEVPEALRTAEVFPFHVEVSEETRAILDGLALYGRGGSDGASPDTIQELYDRMTMLDLEDWNGLKPLTSVLLSLGYRVGSIAGMPNPLGSKIPLVSLHTRRLKPVFVSGIQSSLSIDTSKYLEQHYYYDWLKDMGVQPCGAKGRVVLLTENAFRILDDLLDENTVTPGGTPALWIRYGMARALATEMLMLAEAHGICSSLGLGGQYLEMLMRVAEAVRLELMVEEGKLTLSTFEDWVRVAEKDTALREFLATLFDVPERAGEFVAEGLRAQAYNDLYLSRAGGREDTEGRLGRPMFRPEWKPLLDKRIFAITGRPREP